MTVSSINPPAALEVDGVSAGYGPVAVLREVSVVVPAGAVVALIGANGAGKTTLLRAVSGLLPVRAGKIRLAGRDVTREPAQRRFARGLCHVPEGRGVFRGLTVRENLVLQGAAGQEDESVERAVAAFPILGERLGQQAGTLSGGQQQMLAMAAAYVRNPELVLVDEASLGLAPIVVDEIFGFLAQRAAEGAALLIVDQFARRALSMAGFAYILRRGRIVHGGPAAELADSDLVDSYLGGQAS
ncbi:ABC transporter ATP-binding protein [Amycolatopsis sp. H6(2020)]|nr:ABC transporter ATP-binding protein [Amycolatopsis sp. H6(2020)]